MKALVTGAAGFIASHLAERLVHLEALLDGVTHVFHLAAQAGVRESWGRHFHVYTLNTATRGKPGAVYNIRGGSGVALIDVFELPPSRWRKGFTPSTTG